ncbi:MAG: bifunctional (p)ppGpp synthetase/guanosine-3',5'-bis(diphosphate) 3'-pyrophosphohydrolase, partial [Microthrixaceae bacterium]|nr:bifunctional (p)ppGpp synthetase/guanosine-3',5'-bis(diphosphate) 3'-pyrophosphohydrolase [Microthrixaceae bacterium]
MPAVTRLVPWKRHQQPAAEEVAPVVDQYLRLNPRSSTDLIVAAYELAADAHRGQTRRSGEPYITHPLAVATICARYGMDQTTVIAALLHDAVEDTGLTLADVKASFGADVAEIVDGVTKLERVHFETKEEQQAATLRKMLVAMAKDIRVLVIKLADRLHNMRTIAGLPAWKQERTAQETLDIYAPLAHRLGMGDVKQQLEDLCFAALYPKRFAEIHHMVALRAPERDLYIAQVGEELRQRLAEVKVKAEVTGRPKHLWSIYEKMVVRGKEFDEIFDLVGLRVIVDSVKDCYGALGSIHSIWTPVQGRFKDYIAMPKFNLYQSLHTTVVGPQGKPVEVQVRTMEMHGRAERGVAAHVAYKEGGSEDLAWLSRIIDLEQELSDPGEFMASLKTDLELDEVFVFTPKGDVVTLALGATPIDFAYQIHTEVGHRCVGAKVDGRLVPLDTKLTSGATVEIFTAKSESSGPSRDWLQIAATRSAQAKIRQWFSRERREDALETGREELSKALRRAGLPQKVLATTSIEEVAAGLNYAGRDGLLSAIGEHHLSAESVVGRLTKQTRETTEERNEVLPTPTRKPRRRSPGSGAGVHVEGFDDMLVRIARCCTPVPGDEIMGFVTRGRGVSVHRTDCANAVSLRGAQNERLIDVEWDDASAGSFVALVEVKALDRSRLLQDVASTLSDAKVNILAANTVTGADRVSKMRFEFELGDPSHLETILGRLRGIDAVYDA